MLLSKKNKKRSSSRSQIGKRNKAGRSARLEKLQDRRLMAADFGGFADFYGPRAPAVESVAAQVSTVTTANSNAMEDSPLEIRSRQGRTPTLSFSDGILNITGRDNNEVVTVDFNPYTGNLDIVGETYNRFGQRVGRVTAQIKHSEVSRIRADMKGGHDEFDAKDAYRPVTVYGGWGNDTLIGGAAGDTLRGWQWQ